MSDARAAEPTDGRSDAAGTEDRAVSAVERRCDTVEVVIGDAVEHGDLAVTERPLDRVEDSVAAGTDDRERDRPGPLSDGGQRTGDDPGLQTVQSRFRHRSAVHVELTIDDRAPECRERSDDHDVRAGFGDTVDDVTNATTEQRVGLDQPDRRSCRAHTEHRLPDGRAPCGRVERSRVTVQDDVRRGARDVIERGRERERDGRGPVTEDRGDLRCSG